LSLELQDFWSWRGKVGRAKYVGLGLFLFAIKHNLDRLVAGYFGYDWTILDYWIFDERRVSTLSQHRAGFYATLVLLALPFIWVGVVLTIRRLRDAGLPLWLVIFFFAPFVNLVFFLILGGFPSASSETADDSSFGLSIQRKLSAVIPKSEFGSAAMGILTTVFLAILFTLLSVYWMNQYGWGLFVGIPFFLGLNSVLIYGFHESRRFFKCLLVALLSVVLVGAILFFIAVEGIICLVMAAPLAVALALLGGIIGYFIQRRDSAPPVHIFSALLVVLPGFIVLEPFAVRTPPQFQVRTSIVIDAKPAEVWKHVVSFSQLPAPSERLFKTGIAYPIRAEIDGKGVGAVRHCVFSTGEFVEPIKVWDEPRLLRFDVRSQPRVMDEWSPYNLRPPHLENYLVSREGQFLLTELPDGRTLLEGTTIYQNRIWPAPYWHVWSDYIIHRIHYRVLEHIRNLAEDKREPQP
jgi:uncharacterized membrane protein YhaH (DUF805 family)